MKQIVEFTLESGESIFIELDQAAETDDRISLRDQVVHKATQTFESALETVKPIANAIITKVSSLKQPADEVEVKFGIKISAQLGAVVASGNSEVNYEITLKWKKDSQDAPTV
ncbi:MAG: CU044_2847 family protein [Dolichospermum sp.]